MPAALPRRPRPSPRPLLAWLSFLVLAGAWLGALAVPARPAGAQAGTPPAGATAAGDCPDSTAAAASASAGFVSDYVVLVDVSGSMAGWAGEVRDPTQDIFQSVKDSAKAFVNGLPDGASANLVVLPFGMGADIGRLRQFGLGSVAGPDGGKADAIAYIDGLEATDGETHITEAITVALDRLGQLVGNDETAHAQTILLYTDGIGNGPGDVDGGQPTFENAASAIRAYKQAHPRLFGYYVALGVDLPNTKPLEDVGITVVSSSRDAVPEVRQVSLAMAEPDLGTIRPGGTAASRLCVVAGAGADPVAVSVALDRASLPDGLDLSLAPPTGSLGGEGLPLDWTLGDAPDALAGTRQTVQVQVSTADRGVVLVPGLLDVDLTVAPVVTLGPLTLPGLKVGRDPAPSEPLAWDAPIDYDLGPGGRLTLSADLSRAAAFPGATVGFKVGAAGAVSPTLTLTENGKAAFLHVELPAADAAAQSDGDHAVPFDLVVDAGDDTLRAAQAEQGTAGKGTVGLEAPFSLVPAPTVTIASVAPLPERQDVTLNGGGTLAWTGTTVAYDAANGAAGTLSLDARPLAKVFPHATAAFVLPDGSTAPSVDVADGPGTVGIEIRVPAADAAALGVGDHDGSVALVVDAPGAAFRSDVDGFASGADGTRTLPIAVPVTVSENPQVVCAAPVFQPAAASSANAGQAVWTGTLACSSVPPGVTVAATTEPPTAAGGALGFAAADGGSPSRDASLDAADASAAMRLSVPTTSALGAVGSGPITAAVTVTASDPAVDFVVDGQRLAGPGPHRMLISVSLPPVVAVAPLGKPAALDVSDADDAGRVVEWRLPLAVSLRNGAVADLSAAATAVDGQKLEHATAGISVANGPAQPTLHLDQPKDLSLVLSVPAGDVQAAGTDSVPLCVDLTVAAGPGGALLDWPQGTAGPDGAETGRACGVAVLGPSVEVTVGDLAPLSADLSDHGWTAAVFPPVPVTVSERHGARAAVSADIDQTRYPGATATLADGPGGKQLQVTVPRAALGPQDEQAVPVTLRVDAPGATISVPGSGSAAPDAKTVALDAVVRVVRPTVTLSACDTFGPFPAKVKSNDERDTAPVEVTCEVSVKATSGGGPTLSVSSAGLAHGREHLAPTEVGFRLPGDADDAALMPSVTLGKYQPKAVAVLRFDRQAVRGLGIGTHDATATIGVDPDGSCVATAADAPCQAEPFALAVNPARAEVYEPLCLTCWALRAGGVLAAIAAAGVGWLALPGMPKNAEVAIDGGGQQFFLTDNPSGIGATSVPLGLGQDVATLTGGLFKRVSLSLVPLIDGSPPPSVTVNGAALVPGNPPMRLDKGDVLTVEGEQMTINW